MVWISDIWEEWYSWYLWYLFMIFICVDGGTTRQEMAERSSHLGGQISDCSFLEGTSRLARVLVANTSANQVIYRPS